MPKSFKLPDLGEGIHEGEVLAVLVSAGQEVSEGDIILEVETDKAAVEMPSPYTGKVQEIFVKPGDVVNVGDVMMTFSNGDETTAERPAERSKDKPVDSVPAAETASGLRVARKDGPIPASPATKTTLLPAWPPRRA